MKKKLNTHSFKNTLNSLSIFLKEKIEYEVKYHIFTKFIPISAFSYIFYTAYKYKLYSNFWKENIFSINDEKQIARKLYPILKFKHIEGIYSDKSLEYSDVANFYSNIVKYLKLNFKIEVFLIKSDLLFLNVLANGSLFISDSLYYILKRENENLLKLFITSSVIHTKQRHTVKNIQKIFSRFDLLKQYHKLINGETGYEHYFINYFLYLPFSSDQEISALFDAYKVLCAMNVLSKDDFESIFEKLPKLWDEMNKISKIAPKEIKKSLTQPNKRRVDFLLDNSRDFNLLPNHSINNYTKMDFYNENDELVKHNIYGDYKFKNEIVEVFLHQRSMKKIKYKKREFNLIHPIDKNLIDQILNKKNENFEY